MPHYIKLDNILRFFIIIIFFTVTFVNESPPSAQAATFVVESSADTAGTPVTCGIGDGCTLRQAISLANATAGTDIINIDPSVTAITMSTTGSGENANATGDYDITDTLTINGNGVTITAGAGDGHFHLLGSGSLTLNDATVTGGNVTGDGGSIYVQAGTLTLNNVTVTGNTASQNGGGIAIEANTTVNINQSIISNNTANATNLGGGGIHARGDGIVININQSAIIGNDAANGFGGGIYIRNFGANSNITQTNIVNTTFADNSTGASNTAGAFAQDGTGSSAVVYHSTFVNNDAGDFDGGGDDGSVFDVFEGSIDMQRNILTQYPQTEDGCYSGDPAGNYSGSGNLIDDPVGSCSATRLGATGVTNLGTQTSGSGSIYYPLNAGSNAIDAVASCLTYPNDSSGTFALFDGSSIINVDQIGQTRDASCDIGSIERIPEADLSVNKSSDDSNENIDTGAAWNWTLAITNNGTGTATFPAASTVLVDTFPAGPSYTNPGTVSLSTGSMSCTFAGNILTCTTAAGGTIAPSATINVIVPTSSTSEGTFNNTTVGCTVDSDNVVAETDETNNNCAADDSVTVVAPDLSVSKSSDDSNENIDTGAAWNWTLAINNGGTGVATFPAASTVLVDTFPVGPSYTDPGAVALSTGSMSCTFAGNILTCTTAAGGTIASSATINVIVPTSSTSAGTFNNTTSGCTVDSGTVVAESDESNNNCASDDSVTVVAPNLIATKTNDVADNANAAIPFTWTATITNSGDGSAIFNNGETILLDNLPNTNVSYGSVSVTNVTNVANSGNISCSIVSFDLTCTASGAAVTLGATTGSFDVEIPTTFLASGTFDNPRSAGLCRVDSSAVIPESNESDNDCSNSVTSNVADFTATKSNNVAGSTTLGNSWVWTTRISNDGAGDGIFLQDAVIFTDELPTTDISYGAVSVSNSTGLSGTGSVSCGIASDIITCTAVGGTVIFADSSGGFFDVNITATPTSSGVFDNPRSAGTCAVDPNNAYTVESNEGNNTCSNSVTVTADAPTIAKEFVPDNVFVGDPSTLTFTLGNPNGITITGLAFTDNLPAGTEIAPTPNVGGTCNSNNVLATDFTPNLAAGGTVINLSAGYSLAANSTCTITVDVVATSAGAHVNTTGNITSNEAGSGGTATDTLNAFVSADYGDAPDSYSTTIGSGGPSHELSGSFFGASVDNEIDGQPNPTATGDDTDGNDDEDGIVFTSAIIAGQTTTLDITSTGSGLVNAWIDFNGDGDFGDAGEQIFTDLSVTAGVNSVNFAVPSTATAGTSFARFRIDSGGGLSYTGAAADGEVEDYEVTISTVDLAVTKTVDNPTPNENDTIVFSIVVTNNGSLDTTNITILDQLDTLPITYVSHSINSASSSYNPVNGELTIPSLNSSGSITLEVTVTVNNGTAGTTFTNTASINALDQPDGDSSNNEDDATVTVATVDLAVTKTVNNPTPNTGDNVIYTITVTNNGTGDATGVTLHEYLPLDNVSLAFVNDTPSQGTFTPNNPPPSVWDIGTIPSGDSVSLDIEVTVNISSGSIVNIASIATVDQTDSDLSNNSDDATISIGDADLSVTKTVDNPTPNENDTIVYSISVTNNGSLNATNVVVTDDLSVLTEITYVSDNSASLLDSAANPTSYNAGTGDWSIGALDAGQSLTLQITVTVNAGTVGSTVSNIALLTASDQPDSDLSNNSDDATISIGDTDLRVTKTGPANLLPNATFDWVITIENSGTLDVSMALDDVVLNDDLPASATYGSADVVYGGGVVGTMTCTVSASNLSCTADGALTIPAGETIEVTLPVTAPASPTTLVNPESGTCTVDPNDVVLEGDETNNNCTHTVNIIDSPPPEPTISDPALSKVGVLQPGELGLPGESLTWTITVVAPTSGDVTNVIVSDTFVSELQIDDATTTQGSITISGQTVTVNIGTLTAGSTVIIQVQTTVLESPLDGLFENTATLSADGTISLSADATVIGIQGLPDTGYPPID